MSPSSEKQVPVVCPARQDGDGKERFEPAGSSPPASCAARAVRRGRGFGARSHEYRRPRHALAVPAAGRQAIERFILARLTVESYFWAAEFALFPG